MTRRRVLQSSECPVSRSIDVVGETWSILIVRDAIDGITRFDDFRQHLGISPTMLTQRLNRLVDTASCAGAATRPGHRATSTS